MSALDDQRLDLERPVIIGGIGRSGSTFLQWALTRHPDIHIHGQIGWLGVAWWQEMLDRLVNGGAASLKANGRPYLADYEVLHYGGTPPAEIPRMFGRWLGEYYRGFWPTEKRRWGLKFIDVGSELFDILWPEAPWIVCLRNPWRTFESRKNTFRPHEQLEGFLDAWVAAVAFVDEHANTFLWQIDRIGKCPAHERVTVMKELLTFLGESHAAEVLGFVADWPTVHKDTGYPREYHLPESAKPDMLEKIEGLAHAMAKLGYEHGSA